MTEMQSRYSIHVPIWAIGLVVTIMLALFTWSISIASSSASNEKQIEVNTVLLKDKVSREELNLVLRQLENIEESQLRIEEKLDLHMNRSIPAPVVK